MKSPLEIALRIPMEYNRKNHYAITPFLRITIPLLLGITTNIYLETNSIIWYSLLLVACIINAVFRVLPLKLRWKISLVQGIGILLMIFSFGGVAHSFKANESVSVFDRTEKVYLLKVIGKYKKTNGGKRYLAEIYYKKEPYQYLSKCYIYTKDSLNIFKDGDLIISNCKLEKIKNTSNPGSYDFQKKSATNGIFMKLFIDNSNEFSLIGYHDNKLIKLINKNQEWIVETLKHSLKNRENSGLAEAILIGYREDLDPSLLESYTNTGVVHVIAISGLHVGLIFSIISMMINLIAGHRRGKWISLFITLPLIWWFTILTGSTPSVMRSALMSTFIIIGNASEKKSFAMNSLMAAAFIQMFYNPNIVCDLGFQLSYTAVGSILIFNPLISKFIYLSNKLIKISWELLSVTLAAQLLTTPISIFHFHQFPLLFLFTNLVAVPLSSIILIAEIFLCITNSLTLKTDLFSIPINFLIDTMNGYIRKIETVPFSVINELFIGIPTLLVIYSILIAIFFLIRNKKPINILYLMITIGLTSIIHSSHKTLKSFERRITILNLYQETFVMIQYGQNAMIVVNKKLLENHHLLSTLKKQLVNKYWIKNVEIMSIPEIPCMIKINSSEFPTYNIKNIKHIVLIIGTPNIKLKEYSIPGDSSTLFVADASNKLWKIQEWETEADKLLLRFHAVPEKGPLILESQRSMFSVLKN